MSLRATKKLTETKDVDRRLDELGLDRRKLLNVAERAHWATLDVGAFHAANAAGTYAYQEGTLALREEFVGDDWSVERSESVEAIKHNETGVLVVYCNVDQARGLSQPKARSKKGSGSERVCKPNDNQRQLLPVVHFTAASTKATNVYYLMVDANGFAELSAPVIKDGEFSSYVERIFLYDDGSASDAAEIGDDDGGPAAFDPPVRRK